MRKPKELAIKLDGPYYIEWVDAASTDQKPWVLHEEVEDLDIVSMHSVGWVAKETDLYYIVVAHIAELQYGGDMAIPKASVLRMKKLNINAPRKKKNDDKPKQHIQPSE